MPDLEPRPNLLIIGGGPAGLMAAETARAAGLEVDLYEGKGSVGRKFLIAGKGGMNLTHSEPNPAFVSRYGKRAKEVGRWLADFDATALRDWAAGLGINTFVGSSGRVFPSDLKAAPLLRAWIRRLRNSDVRLHVNYRWQGWDERGALRFATPDGEVTRKADAVVLALGGGSWPQLGSDGAWQAWLRTAGVPVIPLCSSNCGFDIGWSPHLAERHAGAPLKSVVVHWRDSAGVAHARQGECVITHGGIEGSLIYALSAELRRSINRDGQAMLWLDLAPNRSQDALHEALARPRGKRSLSDHLRRQTGLTGVKCALLYEHLSAEQFHDPQQLAKTIKRLPLRLRRARPVAESISSAGGVPFEALDPSGMLHAMPGVFCAGEMLDWEAPTGGYLLTACFASGRHAALNAIDWLATSPRRSPH